MKDKDLNFLVCDNSELSLADLTAEIKTLYPHAKVTQYKSLGELEKEIHYNKTFNVLFLDYQLDKEDVSSFLTRYPRKDRTFDIIVISRNTEESMINSIFDLGVGDYMSKPVDSLILETKLKSILDKKFVSPLKFFGEEGGLGDALLQLNINPLSMNEEKLVFFSKHQIAAGALIHFNEAGFDLELKIETSGYFKEKNGYICEALVLSELAGQKKMGILRNWLKSLNSK